MRACAGIIDTCEGSAVAFHAIAQPITVGIGIKGVGAGIGGVHKDPGPGLSTIGNAIPIGVVIGGIGAGIELLQIAGTIVVKVPGPGELGEIVNVVPRDLPRVGEVIPVSVL